MYGWISWIVLAQSEFGTWDISSLHVFATVKTLPEIQNLKSIRQQYSVVQAEEGGHWLPTVPRKNRCRMPNRQGEGRWCKAQFKNCSDHNRSGAILNSFIAHYLRLPVKFCQQWKLLARPIMEQGRD